MRFYLYPPVQTTVNQGPLEFLTDSLATQVNIDTGTPANSTPLPVIQLDASGNPVGGGALDFGDRTEALRSASQIGNTTGPADFNSGAVGAQTLRAVLEDQSRNALGGVADASQLDHTVDASLISLLKGLIQREALVDFGAPTAAKRISSVLGNSTGEIDYNAGAVSAQSPRVVLESQTRDAIGLSNELAITNPADDGSLIRILKGLLTFENNQDFGASADSKRVSALIGNVAGIADFNAGAASAQTLRSVLEDQSRNSIGSITDASEIDHTLSASIISLLKGLLQREALVDFGVSANAKRISSLIGNDTGLADFNSGAVGAQTLRAVLEDQSRGALGAIADASEIDHTLSASIISLLKGLLQREALVDFGVSTNAKRISSLIGNDTGLADFDSGVVGAQTLRAVLEDQSRNSIGAIADASETDPSASASIIALLKGLLTKLNNPENPSKTGNITSAVKTVGTTAVRATVDGNAPNVARKKLIIKPTIGNSGAIYLGGSAVTAANGLQIVGPDRLEFEVDASDYYLISDTAAQSVEVLEVI